MSIVLAAVTGKAIQVAQAFQVCHGPIPVEVLPLASGNLKVNAAAIGLALPVAAPGRAWTSCNVKSAPWHDSSTPLAHNGTLLPVRLENHPKATGISPHPPNAAYTTSTQPQLQGSSVVLTSPGPLNCQLPVCT